MLKITAVLVLLCAGLVAVNGNSELKLRKLKFRALLEKVRWEGTEPYMKLGRIHELYLKLTGISAYGDLSEEAKRVFQTTTGIFSVGPDTRPAIGPDGLPGRRPAPTSTPAKYDVLAELRKGEAHAENLFRTVSGKSGSGVPNPAGGTFNGPSVFGTPLGPSAIANLISKRLERDGTAISDRRVRKDYRCMTEEERNTYHDAVQTLKESVVNGTNAYDIFSVMHNVRTAEAAHFGPAFLPWHRHFLWLYEEALRQVNPDTILPYWDSSFDEQLDDPLSSALWKNDFLGTANGQVMTGPFANWQTPRNDILRRAVRGQTDFLYDGELINDITTPTTFDDMFQDFEFAHGGPHVYVSGHMNNLDTAAMDPIFFMHHAFVDCLWEEWREDKQYSQNVDPTLDYPSDGDIATMGTNSKHRLTNLMEPFEVRTDEGLNRVYTNIYYRCQRRNTCPGNFCGEDGYGGPNCIPRPNTTPTTPTPTTPTPTTPTPTTPTPTTPTPTTPTPTTPTPTTPTPTTPTPTTPTPTTPTPTTPTPTTPTPTTPTPTTPTPTTPSPSPPTPTSLGPIVESTTRSRYIPKICRTAAWLRPRYCRRFGYGYGN